MTSTFVRLTLLAVVSGLLTSRNVPADEKKPKTETPHADAPGPAHKQLARRAGEYTTVSKFSLKPGTEARESVGTARITSILGGRFLSEESRGQQFGMPVSSLKLYGYNNATKQYEGTWMYTGSTAIMLLVGSSKDDGKTVEYAGSFGVQKGTKMTMAIVLRQIDDDRFVTELIAKNPDGSKGPTLETTYTRKK